MIDTLKVIVADIDGTLVEKGEMIMPITKNAITELHEKGVLFGLATGRSINKNMFKRKDDWGLPFDFDLLIGINGGHLWYKESNEIQSFYLLSTDTMHEILDMMDPLNLTASLYEEDHMVSTRFDKMIAASMMRNHMEIIVTDGDYDRLCIAPNNNLIYRYEEEREKEVFDYISKHTSDKYIAVKTAPCIVEFMDPRLNKGVALSKYSEQTKTPLSQIMAFGDMDNDTELLKTAGWGVCLINGSPSVKAIANAVTEYPCTEDGMGKYLYQHVIDYVHIN